MSKKDNLLKFWESLESHKQSQSSQDIIKPYRPYSQPVKVLPSQSKYKSISQSDLSTRLNPVTSGGKLPGWRAEKTPGGVCPSPPGVKVDGGVSQSESSTLPFMSRNELLFHTTKNRVGRSRSRRPPTRQRKMAKQVLMKMI